MAFPADYTLLATFTVDNTKVSGSSNLTNFPVLLKDGNFHSSVYSNCDDGGGDLRFSSDSDGSTQLACEIVDFDTGASEAQVYVEVPTLDYNDDTVIYIWGDNTGDSQPAVGAAYGRNDTWDDVFKSVFHLETDGTDSAGYSDFSDVSSPSYGTASGVLDSGVHLTGGSSNYLQNLTDDIHTAPADSPYYFEAWVYPDSSQTTGGLFGTKYAETHNYQLVGIRSLYPSTNTNNNAWCNATNACTVDAWQHITMSFDGTTTASWTMDGSTNGDISEDGFRTDEASTPVPSHRLGCGNSAATSFDGYLDEMRIAWTDLGDDWGITSYANQNAPASFGTAAEYSEEEEAGIAASLRNINT